MGLAQQIESDPTFAEDIRLVIWDLDETFWDGTLTEGGIEYRQDHHQLVIELAERGIMSTICSKNERGMVERLLSETGLWEFFVFSSIDWTPKGPRIRAMLEQIGLRASSVLFLDDNPMNLAQAAHINPGLNVGDPGLIPILRTSSRTQGKPDEGLVRLAQYRVKERKAQAQEQIAGDTIEFLRQSNVRVFIEYDVEAHIDRAIELINRTNQLNFTKNRLPDDREAAQAQLRKRLSHNTTDAGLIRVVDDYGDYGFVGFYLSRRTHSVRRLEHFCFSCRTLNMYIEHWLYAFLGRPELELASDVLSNPVMDGIIADWITPAPIEMLETGSSGALRQYDQIFARGGCDLASLMHYFSMHSDNITEEFNQPKNGQMFRRDHTAFLMPSLNGPLSSDQLLAASTLGYEERDFQSEFLHQPSGETLYFLSVWADADVPLYRHKQSNLRVPYWLVGAQNHDLIAREDLREAVAETDVQRARLQTLIQDFEHEGLLSTDEMQARYGAIFDRLPTGSCCVIILANERGPLHYQNPQKHRHPHHVRLNLAIRNAVDGRSGVVLIDPADHIQGPQDMIDLNHFARPVYHRMYCEIIQKLAVHHDEL